MKIPARSKYQPLPYVTLPDRVWPSREHTQAPRWCSVDLRDGNQALAQPMNAAEKLEFFEMLVACGFKEIEVGFPSASQIEFDFIRKLIDEKRIPDDVAIQVLVQCREDLIERTIESLIGAPRVIIHLYNSTSPLQRKVVFNQDKAGIVDIAKRGAQWVQDRLPRLAGSHVQLEYSPESFSSTEVEFALEICEAVATIWKPSPQNKIIFNLPSTVEYFPPNRYADMIEWFSRNISQRENIIISLHTHNDRGTGTAATELGLLAGADRVEGTLFGNGERTGNLDIVNMALNLYMLGIDPQLDFSQLPRLRDVYERCTRLTVPERHPYAGDLVFTAFSGSHQDAINKGFKHMEKKGADALWEVPYIPIDPQDLGRTYEGIIRINAQSGKGGVAYVMENEHGYQLPKLMHKELGQAVNRLADEVKREIEPEEIYALFVREYLEQPQATITFQDFNAQRKASGTNLQAMVSLTIAGQEKLTAAEGNGPVDALMHALQKEGFSGYGIKSFAEHSLGQGAEAQAVAYIEMSGPTGLTLFGAGQDTSIERASLKAVVSALNRHLQK